MTAVPETFDSLRESSMLKAPPRARDDAGSCWSEPPEKTVHRLLLSVRSALSVFFRESNERQSHLQLVGDRDDVVREQCEILARLAVCIVEMRAVERGPDEARTAKRDRKIGEATRAERRATKIDRRNARGKASVVELRECTQRRDLARQIRGSGGLAGTHRGVIPGDGAPVHRLRPPG